MRKIDIEEYKKIVVNVLAQIDRICRENNLEYFLAYGTLIGAIRHNGFIPWDDDIDIIMMRDNYNKLREIICNGDYDIRFIDITTNPDTIYPYGKICDKHTHLKEKNFVQVKDYGAFVDVFPFDYLPEDEEKRRELNKKYRKMEKIVVHSSRTGYNKTGNTITDLKRFFSFHIFRHFNTSKLVKKMDDAFTELSKVKTNRVGVPWGSGNVSYPESYFKNPVEHIFEDKMFYIPEKYDEILTVQYGNYMEPPPENKRIYSHSLECYIDE